MRQDTIVALSSGPGRAAISVIRVSGLQVRFVIETVLAGAPQPRRASLGVIRDPVSGNPLDRCLALFFPGPQSATGEDVLELHVHGSVAVVRSVLRVVTDVAGVRLAQPGEFTRRALENGKLDLLQVEALGDLLNAETEMQLQQAQRQLSGELGQLCRLWRERIIAIRAQVEAELDFADEGDVQAGLILEASRDISHLLAEIKRVLGQAERGRRVRDGASVVVVGAPNAGKSMLTNALAVRDVAIVSDVAGTTRDALEAPLDMDGWSVVLVDTAGLRDAGDAIEREGINRTKQRVASADVILSVFAWDVPAVEVEVSPGASVIRVGTKADLAPAQGADVLVSALTGGGMDRLRAAIVDALRKGASGEPALVARERQREALGRVVMALETASSAWLAELMAEDLRRASFELGRLAGETDLDTVLDQLFRGFCIGK